MTYCQDTYPYRRPRHPVEGVVLPFRPQYHHLVLDEKQVPMKSHACLSRYLLLYCHAHPFHPFHRFSRSASGMPGSKFKLPLVFTSASVSGWLMFHPCKRTAEPARSAEPSAVDLCGEELS